MKKVAIFDIDGTIFRSSLFIELVEELIQEGVFPRRMRQIYLKSYKNWLNRKGTYEEYIGSMVKAFDKNLEGVKYADFKKISAQIALKHKDRVYRYTRDLVKILKNRGYYLLAISHSPKQIVDSFAKKLGFNKIYGAIYECDKNGVITGEKLYKEIIRDKSKILERALQKEKFTLNGSIGVGDSEADIKFLKMVEKPICFNPNKKLYDYARYHKWEIVVERKDVIYHI